MTASTFRPLPGFLRLSVLVLLAAGLAVRLSVALADHQSLIALDIWQDDAFYYLKIARNVVDGRGLTFDGTTTTSAFHPLYLLLLLPIVAATTPDLVAPIHAAGVVLSLVAVVTGVLVFRLTRDLAGQLTALIALAIWAIAPHFVVYGANGLETGLAMLGAVALPAVYVRRFLLQSGRPPSRTDALAVGAVGGLAILARLDLALLLAAIGVDAILRAHRRNELRRRLPVLALIGLAAAGVWLPWGVVSRAAGGTWLPASGAASRQIALNYGWKNLQPIWAPDRVTGPGGEQLFDPDEVPGAYWADVATQQLLTFAFEHPLAVPLRLHLPHAVWPRLDRYPPYAAFRSTPWGTTVLALLLAAVATLFVRRFASREAASGPGPPLPGTLVAVYLALTFVGYTFYCPAHWYYPRYLAPATLLTTVVGLAAARRRVLPLWRRSSAARGALMLLMLAPVAGQLVLHRGSTLSRIEWQGAAPGGFLRGWRALSPAIRPENKLGAFQAGVFSYFGERDVINLDGKVNPEARQALADKRLAAYIAEQGIDTILDWPWVVGTLCVRHMQPGELIFREIAQEPEGGYGFVLFHVEPGRD